jgi:hypothetical protein
MVQGNKKYRNLVKKRWTWWRGEQLVIPDNGKIKDKVLFQAHNAKFAGHPGRTKTYDLVTRDF